MTVSTLNQHPILPKSTTSLPLRAEGHPEHEAGRPDLTLAQIDAFGAEMDALRKKVVEDLGEVDANYLRDVVDKQRKLELLGRGLLAVGIFPPAFVAGVGALALSKIIDNMEIGHNVMHGQYDWMRDEALNSLCSTGTTYARARTGNTRTTTCTTRTPTSWARTATWATEFCG